jgi:cell pole-organizing protein PopZ
MEEILASIRKIISEDANEAHSPPPAQQPVQILELTQEVHDEPELPPVVSEPSHPETEGQLEASGTSEQVASESVAVPAASMAENVIPMPLNEETNVSSSAQISHDGIFSEKSRQAIDDAFAGLDQLQEAPRMQSVKPAAMQPVEGNSIEAVFERAVRSSVDPVLAQWMSSHQDDLLSAVKPLLRDWMDDHFPALLEGAVRDEVARVIRARGGR